MTPYAGERRIRNARIESTRMGYDPFGNFHYWIGLTYGDSVQEFGGWKLGAGEQTCVLSIANLLKAVEVDAWEDLVGSYVRVESDRACVYAIGHPILEWWFRPYDELVIVKIPEAKEVFGCSSARDASRRS